MALSVFVYNFGVEDKFLGVIVQRFSCMLDFDEVETLSIYEFPYLSDELTGPF